MFADFIQAALEDFDIDKALKLAEQVGKEARENILLKNFADEITKQAYLLVFKLKCKLFRSIDAKEVQSHIAGDAVAILTEALAEDGFESRFDQSSSLVTCKPARSSDAEIVIKNRAIDMLNKTSALNEVYQQQLLKLNQVANKAK